MKSKNLKNKYQLSKSANTGDTCICPSCGTEFIKSAKPQAFCKSKKGTVCKDYYWNNVTPDKKNNTKRISPANMAWQDGNKYTEPVQRSLKKQKRQRKLKKLLSLDETKYKI